MDQSHIDWVAPRNPAQGASILGSSALPVFIADSMNFVIVSQPSVLRQVECLDPITEIPLDPGCVTDCR